MPAFRATEKSRGHRKKPGRGPGKSNREECCAFAPTQQGDSKLRSTTGIVSKCGENKAAPMPCAHYATTRYPPLSVTKSCALEGSGSIFWRRR